jgi:capsular exopolysaccharide synthesis family protein
MTQGPLDLRDYMAVLVRRRWTIAPVVLVSMAVAIFISYRQAPLYASTAEVAVRPARFDPKQPSAAFGFLNMGTESRIANSLPVAGLARKILMDRNIVPGTVSASSTVVNQQDAGTLQFVATAPNPAAAQATAQAYAEAYLQFRRNDVLNDLEGARRPLNQQLSAIGDQIKKKAAEAAAAKDDAHRQVLNTQLTGLLAQQSSLINRLNDLPSESDLNVGDLLQAAAFPSSPSNADHLRAGVLGIVVGLGLGVGIAFLRERLDQGVRGRDELEFHSGAPVLAFIPRLSSRKASLILLDQPDSPGAEAMKGLRVRLLHAAAQHGFKTILITSSFAGDGKTSMTTNLGVALARSGKEVVLVSADLHRPRMHEYFPPVNGNGLTGVLMGQQNVLEALSRSGVDNLWVLHSGAALESSSQPDVFGSDSMKQVLKELSGFADFVLIDSPPLLAGSDATALATMADGVLFVVDVRNVQAPVLEQVRLELKLVSAPMIGVIVNNYDPRRFQSYSYRYRYASYAPEPEVIRLGPVPNAVSTVLMKREELAQPTGLPNEPPRDKR